MQNSATGWDGGWGTKVTATDRAVQKKLACCPGKWWHQPPIRESRRSSRYRGLVGEGGIPCACQCRGWLHPPTGCVGCEGIGPFPDPGSLHMRQDWPSASGHAPPAPVSSSLRARACVAGRSLGEALPSWETWETGDHRSRPLPRHHITPSSQQPLLGRGRAMWARGQPGTWQVSPTYIPHPTPT